MNLRFLVLAGPRVARARIVRRAGLDADPVLRPRSSGQILEVWAPGGTPVAVSADGAAIVIGSLLQRSESCHRCDPGGADWAPAVLLANCWGPYLAFGERDGDGHFALRDPSGAVVAYHRRDDGCDIYASDDDLIWRGARAAPAPDLGFIREWLTYPFLRGARTGVAGVNELMPGQTLVAAGREITLDQAWTPASHFPARRGSLDATTAVRRLRETLLDCVPRLVPPGQHPVLKLSGGLDSSLVAAALAHADRPFTAVTFATRDRDGDERHYARAVAEACGAELIEIVEDPGEIVLDPAPGGRLRPPRQPLLQRLDRAYSDQWAASAPDLVITGAGGDNVFAALPTAVAASDAWSRSGPLAALRTVRDLAAVHDCTVWKALGHARRRAQRGSVRRWPTDTRFLTADAIAPGPEPHPWLVNTGKALPGSVEHLRMIAGTWRFLGDPAPDAPAMLHPLLAQPILELCLAIPSWLWVSGGRDRAIARAALADLLPGTVLERRSKGGLGAMFRGQFEQLARPLGELLIEGRLAEAGVVDRGAVMRYLARCQQWDDGQWLRLLDLAAAEQWLRAFDIAAQQPVPTVPPDRG